MWKAKRAKTGKLGTCARHDSWCLGQILITMETPVLPLRDINLSLAIAKVNKANQTNSIGIIAERSTNKGGYFHKNRKIDPEKSSCPSIGWTD